MIKSMTGFAALTREDDRVALNVTLRAVNHRFLDVQTRMPPSLGDQEARIRALVQQVIARGRVEAPFDGTVIQGDLTQSIGAPVQQGDPLMTIARTDGFRVIVEVDERDIQPVRVGQQGSLALSALPWNTLPLRVTRITPVATTDPVCR